MNVYIDGACTNNGQSNARAGYGVFFGEKDPRNACGRVIGKQSNNTGELTAFIKCFEIIANDVGKKKINIYIDSEYVIKCATTYGDKLAKSNWVETKPIPNLSLVKRVHELFKNAKNVVLHHIEAHTDRTDEHSLGNAGADRLASSVCTITDASSASSPRAEPKRHKEIKLEWVSFDIKDKAKELGAKWNTSKKHWYITEDTPEENKKKLQELHEEQKNMPVQPKASPVKKSYISIEFAKKDAAKKLGARWDPGAKSWYYVEEDMTKENIAKMKAL